MMKLITESRFDVEWKADNEGKEFFIEGIFSSADIENQNGRKYKRATLDREINKLMEAVKNKCAWGELSHPVTPKVNEDRISHLIENLEWKGNDVVGRARIVPTPMGNIARTLISTGKLGISSRGLGTVNEADGYVNDDFNLLTYDLVSSPSNDPSWVKGIYEGQEFFLPSKEEIQPVKDESVIITEAKEAWKRHVWQVLENIERNL